MRASLVLKNPTKVRSKLQSPMNSCAPAAHEVFNREQKCMRRGTGLKVGDTTSAHYYAASTPFRESQAGSCQAWVRSVRDVASLLGEAMPTTRFFPENPPSSRYDTCRKLEGLGPGSNIDNRPRARHHGFCTAAKVGAGEQKSPRARERRNLFSQQPRFEQGCTLSHTSQN
jgi:hypothetical protein